MNKVILIGRLTKDPETSVQGKSQLCVCRFSVAISRGKGKDGADLGTDFPNCVAFGKVAENLAKYCAKGSLVAVDGNIQTGSYEKDGKKVFTTDVVAQRVEFLSKSEKPEAMDETPSGFSKLSQDEIDALPF